MWQRASDTVNLEMKNNIYMFSLIIFIMNAKNEYYDYVQADFDFGQVHVIWWLSYCQVGEKISVEPWIGKLDWESLMPISWFRDFTRWQIRRYWNRPQGPFH